jgi:hypothetical protein
LVVVFANKTREAINRRVCQQHNLFILIKELIDNTSRQFNSSKIVHFKDENNIQYLPYDFSKSNTVTMAWFYMLRGIAEWALPSKSSTAMKYEGDQRCYPTNPQGHNQLSNLDLPLPHNYTNFSPHNIFDRCMAPTKWPEKMNPVHGESESQRQPLRKSHILFSYKFLRLCLYQVQFI